MTDWSIDDSLRLYNIARWGEGYYGINDAGHVMVLPEEDGLDGIDLLEASVLIRESGLSWPVLVRFPQILTKRLRELCSAFDTVLHETGGSYTPVYPIKVNQNRHVVAALLKNSDGRIGLEAGSKPEMLAVMALSHAGGTVICNGYKDAEYIRLALTATRMGLRCFIVLEKPSELALVIEQSRHTGIRPLLGIRVKPASIAQGKWQNSGGEKSKFGLTADQVLSTVEQLRQAGMLECLQLLHVHLGSQMSNIHDIHNGLVEAARFYAELSQAGVPLKVADVGGGLGIDYEGVRTRSECSVNYDIREYATKVVHAFAQVCQEHGLDMPELVSESGRALSAHHAMLITNVVDVERHDDTVPTLRDDDSAPAMELRGLLARLDSGISVREVFHDTQLYYQEAQGLFTHGQMSLPQRAIVEQLYYAICYRIFSRLNPAIAAHRQIISQLEDSLADKVFCNFSVFQSMPDVWAIDQVFPIVPLQRLNERPSRRAIIHDLTCDSDGRIDLYVDHEGVESTLALHECDPGHDYLVGMFLVGAYQETLGDIHNLFGDTASVNIIRGSDGDLQLEHAASGENVRELLASVGYDPAVIRERIAAKVRHCVRDEEVIAQILAELEADLDSYSYLLDDD